MESSMEFEGQAIDTFSYTFSTDSFPVDPPDRFAQSRSHDAAAPPSPPRPANAGATVAASPTATHATSATSTSTAAGLNPRSCVTCRKRKVRCDKKHPCANCHKASIECVFPRPGRAPRRTKKPPDTELLARLRRLEGVVHSLGIGVDGEELSHGHDEGEDGPEAGVAQAGDGHKSSEGHSPLDSSGAPAPYAPPCQMGHIERGMGRLVVEDGRSRYVNSGLWAGLTEQIAEMHDILDDPTDEEEDYPSPESGASMSNPRQNHQTFIFGYSSAMTTLRILHPPAKKIMAYWEVYKENVSPLVRMLHWPTTEQLMRKASDNLDGISKTVEALMFAIYFATVTSLTPEECQSVLAVDKDIAVKRYRFGTEQALAKAGFLGTQEVMVLQAFALFLVSVRRHDDSKFVWMLVGLAIRMATSLGVHRDGNLFNLKPFETEMRRRLWWQVGTLDVRASEDQGSEPSILREAWDSRRPLNINDEDIWPDMESFPPERVGATEMTFDLVRYEIGSTMRHLIYGALGTVGDPMRPTPPTLEEKEKMLDDLNIRLEEKFLKYCNPDVPLEFVTIIIARLVLAKVWLTTHHPFTCPGGESGMTPEDKDKLFRTSIDIIKYTRLLETQKKSMKWSWMFRTNIQWHAVALLLSELCVRVTGSAVDEAWFLVEGVFSEWGGSVSSYKKSMLWKPIRKLMAKARAVRAKQLEKERLFPLDGSLGPSGLSPFMASEVPMTASQAPPANGAFDSNFSTDTSQFGSVASTIPLEPSPGANLFDPDPLDRWMIDDAAILQNPMAGEDSMNWAGWDNMVKDFQNESAQDEPGPFNLAGWW